MTKVHFSSVSNEWATPQWLFDRLNKLYGPFTLDPCATPENAKCKHYYTLEDNGLAQLWSNEVVFMNPPYGREIGAWVSKAYTESHSLDGHPAKVVCLIPARTDTSYWHEYVMKASEICLIRGRLYFSDGDGRAPFPSAIIVFASGTIPHLSSLDARGRK